MRMSPAAEGAPATSTGSRQGSCPRPLRPLIRQKTIPRHRGRARRWAHVVQGGYARGHSGAHALTTFFDVDVGFGAITIALVLLVISPAEQERAFTQMPWSAILLVTGIVTYVSVLESIGTFDYVESAIAAVGSPGLAALAAAYVGRSFRLRLDHGDARGPHPARGADIEDPAVPALGVVTAIALASSVVEQARSRPTGRCCSPTSRTWTAGCFSSGSCTGHPDNGSGPSDRLGPVRGNRRPYRLKVSS